jgi:uncharacterized protein (TIGR02217 family)
MINFHNVKLPNFLALHAKGSPVFATSVATTASGREARLSDRLLCLQKYTISNCRLSPGQFEEFNGFFRARKGRQYSFCMRDFADCLIHNKLMPEASGQIFKVFKIYPDQLEPYARRITKLVPGSVALSAAGLDIRPQEIDHQAGIVMLESPLQDGHTLMINARFDVQVRFSSDDFKYSIHLDGSIIIDDLEMLEVL